MKNIESGTIFWITGLSGSGKSTALKAFDDCGYECVDNIPIELLDGFSKFIQETKDSKDYALLLDVKEEETHKMYALAG